MSEYVFKLPDLGEGTVEAEIVEWHVKPGDQVTEGDVIADVMTDKANVEVPAPVSGKVLRITGEPGDIVAVGAELIAIETTAPVSTGKRRSEAGTEAKSDPAPAAEPKPEPEPEPTSVPKLDAKSEPKSAPESATESASESESDSQPESELDALPEPNSDAERTSPARATRDPDAPPPATSPAIRRRAKEAGIDLADVPGSGPGGRILRKDFDAFLQGHVRPAEAPATTRPAQGGDGVQEIKIIGVRRVIAQRLSQSAREIPHFAYVEEVDITELEALRAHLNTRHEQRLTLLPFLAQALIRALPAMPRCNAHYDAEAGVLRQYDAVHLGIATQTGDGLKVPVVHDAQRRNLWQLSAAIREAAQAARDGTAKLTDLTGSTITISSLGRLGGIASTPIINHPEVAILGINKAVERPVLVHGQIQVRTMMNISGSFDHRFIDGADAAALVADMKAFLENPATMWLEAPG